MPTGYEAQALQAWKDSDPEWSVISFDMVSERTGLDRKKVRRAVRGLARKGLTEFCRTSWDDEGKPHGAGYELTKKGRQVLDEMVQSAEPQPAGAPE
jgi:hypothetical protein